MIRNSAHDSAPGVASPPSDHVIDKLSSLLEIPSSVAAEVFAAAKKLAAAIVTNETANLKAIRKSVRASVHDAIRELRERHLEGMATAVVLTAAVLIMNTQLTYFVANMFVSRRVGLQASALVTTP